MLWILRCGIFNLHLVEVLQCPTCNAEKYTDTTFRSVAVDIPDNLENGRGSIQDTYLLVDLLRDMVKPEILDKDNMWQCSACNEQVCAMKKRNFKILAPSFVLHLKRFRFDPVGSISPIFLPFALLLCFHQMSKKRRKVTSPVEIPVNMTPQSYLDADGDESYSLTGVIVHLGTAMGGHYKAYVPSPVDPKVWWECNDEHIHALSSEEIEQLFGTCDEVGSAARQTLMENAYMLFYSKSSASRNSIEISSEVKDDNSAFSTLVRLENIRLNVVQSEVVVQRVTDLNHMGEAVTMYFPKNMSMAQLSSKVYQYFTAKNAVDANIYPLSNCRIRRFSSSGSGKGETFAGKEDCTLNDLGFGDKELLCFEVRQPNDPSFIEFNPHDMILYFKKWSDINAFADDTVMEANQWTEIMVPGREQATVGALRSTIAEAISCIVDKILLVSYDKSVPLALLDDDQAELRRKYRITPGNRVVVEIKADSCSESVALHELKAYRSRIRLQFNNPHSGKLNTYDNDLETRLDATLFEVKQLVAEKLEMSLDAFHLRRNESSPQFKDESKTLDELSISDQSILHVEEF